MIQQHGQKGGIPLGFFIRQIVILGIMDDAGTAEDIHTGTETNHILANLLLYIFLQTGNSLIDRFGVLVPALEEYQSVSEWVNDIASVTKTFLAQLHE